MKDVFFHCILPLLLMPVLCLAGCCTTDDILAPDTTDGEAIAFSLSDVNVASRAGFTGAVTEIAMRMQSDEKNTSNKKYTRTVAKASIDQTNNTTSYSTVDFTGNYTRYWNDAFGRDAQLSVFAVAVPNLTNVVNPKTTAGVTGTALANLLAVGNSSYDNAWGTEGAHTIAWQVTTDGQTLKENDADHTVNSIGHEDLVYSNNIQDGGKDGLYKWDYTLNDGEGGYKPATSTGEDGVHGDGRMEFRQPDGAKPDAPGHFDKGHLKFQHALSRLSIKFEVAASFGYKDGLFKFTNGKNITLVNFPYKGTLTIPTGVWSDVENKTIDRIASDKADPTVAKDATFTAQMLPGYKFYKDGANKDVGALTFVIDDNTYYVTQEKIFDALNVAANTGTPAKVEVKTDDSGYKYIEMEQGKHYHLTIAVGKTAVQSLTATLAPWVDVNGELTSDNTRINVSLNVSGSNCDQDIDLYRLGDDYAGFLSGGTYEGKNWYGDYATDAEHKTQLLHSAATDGKWSTGWKFESNKTYYHFRTVNSGTTIVGNTGTGSQTTKDYFTITAGPVADANSDPHWGAPMKTTTTTWLKYDPEKGYEAHLNPAIGATKDEIKIQELHMMSKVNVILKTTAGDDKVLLEKDGQKATVQITRIASSGTVEMGRGLVTPTEPYTATLTLTVPTAPTTYFKTPNLETNAFSYAVVPQALCREDNSTNDDDYVGITITTPDDNQYYFVKRLAEIKATSVTDGRDQTVNTAIKRWYPGHTYTYTFTLTKKGISDITATVADWIDVVAENTDINLEN